MASLKLEHIYKVYPNGHKAVTDFNMDIKDGEFIVFVGPSGCGKSTTLRMIAGLEDISSGEFYIGDTLVNDMQPKDRDIAMVFQNYALYPHMTVYENMAFGLTLRKMPRAEIHERVMWAAEVLGLKDYLDRKPKAMSGGQRQRVSLGRAILRNPKVMLLDEPLSNLDAKLRGQMRSMISKLHQQLKTTFIYVTHDQVEAMTLGTRVVVMKLGVIQQVDTPQNLYDHPINKFVAGFIGTPQMNFFNVKLKEEKDHVDVLWTDCPDQPALKLSNDQVLKAEKKYLQGDIDVTLGFRCEAVSAEEEDVKSGGDNLVNVIVSHFEELGNETLIYGDLKELEGLTGGESTTTIVIKASSKMGHKPGDVIKARINVEKIHLFDNQSEMTIIPQVPDHDVLPVEISGGRMKLFGSMVKPESINIDLLQKGTISIPLAAITVNKGDVKGKVVLVEEHGEQHLALVEAEGNKLFMFVEEGVKKGDALTFSVDYSQATFRDENDMVVLKPLVARDNLYARFVNFKTAFEETQNPIFNQLKDERVAKVEEKYAELEAKFNEEMTAALNEAAQKEAQVAPTVEDQRTKMVAENSKLKLELKELGEKYRTEVKEIKAKHAQIMKDTMAKVEAEYKKMWNDEKEDYKKAMATNKDKESRRSRRLSYQVFKESFPQMKSTDIEKRSNSLEFDKETELNGAKARYVQQKALLGDQIKENERKFNEECFPLELAKKEYEKKQKELQAQKKDEIIHAQLLFFFKYDDYYQVIPDEITKKIIQGLGNKVFTKIFRIEAPHDGYVEQENTMTFKVVSLVNYGDVKLYKCTGELDGEAVVIYINKDREIDMGATVYLAPQLEKAQIYEDDRNIRLY